MAQNGGGGPPPTPDQRAVAALGEFTKWFTGLATAGLAFSIGLQANIASYGVEARRFLVWAWLCYAIAIVAGILVQSSFPKLIQKSWTIDNPWVKGAYWLSFFGLALGSAYTFLALRSFVATQVAPDQLAVRTAQDAVRRAVALVQPRERFASIDKIEVLPGADAKSVGDETWHVQLIVTRGSGKAMHQVRRDVFFNATSGHGSATESTKR